MMDMEMDKECKGSRKQGSYFSELYVSVKLKLNHKRSVAPSQQYSEGLEILKCLYKWKEISCGFGVCVVIYSFSHHSQEFTLPYFRQASI